MAPSVGYGGTSNFSAYPKKLFSSKSGAGLLQMLQKNLERIQANLSTSLISRCSANYTQVNSAIIDFSSDIRASEKIESTGLDPGGDSEKIPSSARKMKKTYGAMTFLIFGLWMMKTKQRLCTTSKSKTLAAPSNGFLPIKRKRKTKTKTKRKMKRWTKTKNVCEA